jgi:hypothetical protein
VSCNNDNVADNEDWSQDSNINLNLLFEEGENTIVWNELFWLSWIDHVMLYHVEWIDFYTITLSSFWEHIIKLDELDLTTFHLNLTIFFWTLESFIWLVSWSFFNLYFWRYEHVTRPVERI